MLALNMTSFFLRHLSVGFQVCIITFIVLSARGYQPSYNITFGYHVFLGPSFGCEVIQYLFFLGDLDSFEEEWSNTLHDDPHLGVV